MKAKLTRRIIATLLVVVMLMAILPSAFAGTFPDVPAGIWYEDAVEYCAEKGLMSGTDNGFNPMGKVTREQTVQTLYALEGKPEVAYTAKFTDVADKQWYTSAILWAVANGITSGMGDGSKFGVGVNVTREQLAIFLQSYAKLAEKDITAEADLSIFPDNAKADSWAVAALKWAVAEGFLSGKKVGNDTLLAPRDELTRAELAVILAKFNEYINESPIDPIETDPIETEPIETEPIETDPIETDPIETDPIETDPIETDPIETEPIETEPIETDPVDNEFTLASELKDGDEVIIVNVAASKALSEAAVGEKYRAGVDVTPADNAIESDDSAIIWTVVKTDDGYQFVNDNGETLSATSGLSFADTDNVWTLIPGTAENTFIISSTTAKGSQGDPKSVEWYAQYEEFSTYYKNDTNEDLFAVQFYVRDGEPVCEHVWEKTSETAATCTTAGSIVYTCSECGATKTEAIEALGHDIVIDEAVAATCTEPGKTEGSHCSRCDYAVAQEELPALGHDYVSGICSRCEEADPNYNPECKHENTEVRDAKDATCTEPGYTGDTYCVDCGAKIATGEEIAKLAHTPETDAAVAATCTEPGKTEGSHCSVCGAIIVAQEDIPVIAHNYVDGVCSVCGAKEPSTDLVAIYYPKESKVMTTEEFTYAGKTTKIELCAADAELADGTVTTDAENVALFEQIDNGDGILSFKTEDGKFLYADGTDVKLVAEEGENTKFVLEEADGGVYIRCATANYNGKAQYLEYYSNYFTVYGMGTDPSIYVFNLYPVAAPCDHNWDDGVKTKDPTCENAGETTYTCSLCGKTKTEPIAALGHEFVAGEPVAASCTQYGYTPYTCTRCNKIEERDIIGKLAHIDEDEDNLCDVCGADLTVPEKPEGFSKITDAADLEDGKYLIVCEEFNIALNAGLEKVDAGHNVIDVVITDGTIEADDTTTAAVVEIASMEGGYSLMAGNGKYLSGNAGGNALNEGADPVANTITFAEGNAIITAGRQLQFNKTSGDTNFRFRYYTAGGQTAVQLYKLNEGPACPHDWDEGKITKEATCVDAGETTYTCSLCNKTRTEEIAALGHIDEDADNKCDRCGKDLSAKEGFNKITSTSELTAGKYLIVCEEFNVALDAGREKVDSAHNVIEVTIANGAIAADATTTAAVVEIAPMEGGYSIKAGNGKYLFGASGSNTLGEGAEAKANTITFDGGNAIITAGRQLQFNKKNDADNFRFRYYTAGGQTAIQLYKLG